MLIIGSRRGFMVAFLGVAAGFLAVIGGGALGAATKSVGIGFLVMGGVIWLLGRHEPERSNPCSLFFIPLRLYAVVSLAAGGLFLAVPNTTSSPLPSGTPTPQSPKLNGIESRLRAQTAWGSTPAAAEKAAGYQKAILGFERIAGGEGKVNVHLDVDGADFKEASKVTLYVQTIALKKYGDEGKKGLASICLKMLRADFPKATCQVAARGPFLWGVQGWTSPDPDTVPVITRTSDTPRF
jgi:hypothetical protein